MSDPETTTTAVELVPYDPNGLAPAPSTAVAARDTVALAPAAWNLSQRLANTDFVPRALRGKPEAVLAAILTGNELGLGAMQALSKIHVIEGRPSLAAELVRALIVQRGHDFAIEEWSNTRCTVVGRRRGSDRETRVTWTMDDARTAGLVGKDNWKKYPRAMLLARATGDLGRAVFPEVLAGLYLREELEDGFIFDEAVDVTPAEPPAPAPARSRRRAPRGAITRPAEADGADPAPASEASASSAAPPLPGEEEEPPPSPPPSPAPVELVDEPPADDYEGPDEHLDAAVMPWPNAFAARTAELLTDDERHGLYSALSAGRASRGAELEPLEQRRAEAAAVLLKRGEAGLANIGDVWALVELERGVTASSEPLDDGLDLAFVAPPNLVGELYRHVKPSASASAKDEAEPAGAEEAPPTPTSSAAGDSFDVTSEDEWRAFMRARTLRVSDVIKAAIRVTAKGSKPPTNLAELVAAPELAARTMEALR